MFLKSEFNVGCAKNAQHRIHLQKDKLVKERIIFY